MKRPGPTAGPRGDRGESVLANGLTVVWEDIPRVPSVSAGLWIRTGSRDEGASESGISHFLEHLLFKGAGRRGCAALARSVERTGGTMNGFTAEEATCLLVRVPAARLEPALSILADLAVRPLLRDGDVGRERSVVLDEIRSSCDSPSRHVHEVFDAVFFAGHPLAMPVAGSADSVGSLSGAAVRAFHRRRYRAGSMVLSIAGSLPRGFEGARAGRWFGALEPGCVARPRPWSGRRGGRRWRIVRRDTEQAHFCLGFPSATMYDEGRFAAAVAATILGGNMSSRLFQDLRERRGLVYDIRSWTRHLTDAGCFGVSGSCAPDRLGEVLRRSAGAVRRLAARGVSLREIAAAREYLVGQFVLGLEDPMEMMLWTGERRLFREGPAEPEAVAAGIRAVDGAAASGSIPPDAPLHVAVVGPLGPSAETLLESVAGSSAPPSESPRRRSGCRAGCGPSA